jgi:hypothetical protein
MMKLSMTTGVGDSDKSVGLCLPSCNRSAFHSDPQRPGCLHTASCLLASSPSSPCLSPGQDTNQFDPDSPGYHHPMQRATTMVPDPNIISSNASSANTSSRMKSNRRRSFFNIPLGVRSKSFGYDDIDGTLKSNTSIMLAGSVLPQDIIREVVDLLSPADILNFSLTVRDLSFFLSHYSYSVSSDSLPTSGPSSFQPCTIQSSSNQVNTAAEPLQCFFPNLTYARTSKS